MGVFIVRFYPRKYSFLCLVDFFSSLKHCVFLLRLVQAVSYSMPTSLRANSKHYKLLEI